MNPICPGCKKEMSVSDIADFECNEGCGDWYFTDPEKDNESTESLSDSGGRMSL